MKPDRYDNSKSLVDDYNIADMLRAYKIIGERSISNQPDNEVVDPGLELNTSATNFLTLTAADDSPPLKLIDASESDLVEPDDFWHSSSVKHTADKPADFWSPWLLVLVGILGGAILTLLMLQSLNGTLVLNNQKDVQQLQNQISVLVSQNKTLSSELLALKVQLAILTQERIAGAEGDIDQLHVELDTIHKQASFLTEQAMRLDDRIGAIGSISERGSISNHEAHVEIEILQARISEVQSQIGTLESDNEAVQSSVQTLQNNVDKLNQFLITFRDFLLSEEGATGEASPIQKRTIEEPVSSADSEN